MSISVSTQGNFSPGCLYGLGLGPGDPELVTLKAQRILSQVEVIFVPTKGVGHRSYARSILSGVIEGGSSRIVELVFPMRKGAQDSFWQEAVERIGQELFQGKDCAFVTEGDPFLYGTFVYVFSLFRERHPEVRIEVVSGVSSINAASARALFPLSSGAEKIAILPAAYEPAVLKKTLEDFDTVILMKVYNVFDELLGLLEERGLADNCVYVKGCTTAEEEIVTDIRTLRGQKLDYFSLLIVRR